jgi:hypothetical protein
MVNREEQVQHAEHEAGGRRGVACRGGAEAEEGDERQVQNRAGGSPQAGAR